MSKLAQTNRPAVVVFGAVALALAGCSGSSSDAQDEIAVRPIPSFAATNAVSQTLFAEALTLKPTLTSRLPVTGTATYTGAVAYVDSNISPIPDDLPFPEYETFIVNNPDYVSRVQLLADFEGESITGSMDSFRDTNNGAHRIDMNLNGSIFNSRSDTAAFTGTLTGTNEVPVEGGGFETKNFTGVVAGSFLGSQAESVLGTLAINRGFEGDASGDVFGVLTAEQ